MRYDKLFPSRFDSILLSLGLDRRILKQKRTSRKCLDLGINKDIRSSHSDMYLIKVLQSHLSHYFLPSSIILINTHDYVLLFIYELIYDREIPLDLGAIWDGLTVAISCALIVPIIQIL